MRDCTKWNYMTEACADLIVEHICEKQGNYTNYGVSSVCGSVYVVVGYEPLLAEHKFAKKLMAAGFTLKYRDSSPGLHIYIGNSSGCGDAAAKGQHIATLLRQMVVPAFCDIDVN